MTSVTVYTDGACIDQGTGNARAGYGVFWGDGHRNNRFGRVTGPQDSNRAELFAAQKAIKTASRNGYKSILICTDSSYVVDTIPDAQNYQTYLSFGFLQNRELMQSIHDMSKKINVSVAYIKGHSGVHGNEQANMLAKAGANL